MGGCLIKQFADNLIFIEKDNMDNRNLTYSNIIVRSDGSRHVTGCAIKFNSDSNDMGFIERIRPEAVTEDVLMRSDIFVYLDHQKDRGVLARSNHGVGSLHLDLRDDGLYYDFDAPATQLGDELLSYLERGEINSSSFAFTVADGGDKWYRDADGKIRRDIYKIERLFDCSPVFSPAYSATSCQRRGLDDFMTDEANKKELAEWRERINNLC